MSDTKSKLGSLKGVKVVDLGRPIAGAMCSMILADMGAETITVERPRKDIPGLVSYMSRSKKSVTLNLQTPKGKEILRRLIKWGDVLIENNRPGVMQRLGFDYPSVKAINPRIIMTSISGYGQTGPYAHRGGFDTVGQAMGGLMSLTGPTNGPPYDANASLADISSGVFGALGTLLALYHQQATGLGQYVESTLVESIVFFMVPELISQYRGMPVEKGELAWWKRRPGAGWFQAKDGPYIVIMAQTDQHWPLMCEIMGKPELATTPGYANRSERPEHAQEIHKIMEEWARSHTSAEIEAVLDKADIPFGRVQTIEEVLKDPQLNFRNMFKKVDCGGETIPLFGPYPVLSDTPGSFEPPARLGQHNEEVYCGLLGIPKEELVTMKKEGVI
jgi:CoA:oxalate CoA-transferase